jgi:hypothetical protein
MVLLVALALAATAVMEAMVVPQEAQQVRVEGMAMAVAEAEGLARVTVDTAVRQVVGLVLEWVRPMAESRRRMTVRIVAQGQEEAIGGDLVAGVTGVAHGQIRHCRSLCVALLLFGMTMHYRSQYKLILSKFHVQSIVEAVKSYERLEQDKKRFQREAMSGKETDRNLKNTIRELEKTNRELRKRQRT